MNVDRKAALRRIDEIRRVLLADWDPLSVGSNPKLSDEYDFCLGKVLKAIDTGEAGRVVDLLVEMEDYLGVGPTNRESLAPVARRLLELPRT
ncbi:hypothetical protein [Caulobacter sp. BK020]|uniref:hypothetical protein n=1 Tax=Caulobacter sp. BK020 TaxID=2512117 RepID=UPI0010515167|nr:hypothetical protein [Caulobacter sp. BK020]TCS14135.1 hypothetical protein EV278_108196 [Caulobacter sp. BK020]